MAFWLASPCSSSYFPQAITLRQLAKLSTCSTSKQTKTKRSAEGWHYVIATLDGAEWLNRQLKVNKARPRENRSSFGGGYRNKRF